ncbi:MAG TPA: HypC/HybG/HupF family hydrogenase formation chaperone [Terriglobia bacterium]|jgi:hydrogenase expression/formation protein HypC|nr:HypC/HybG/HupF family hydrogenase formation chaperone [Terriglobia bacterium]
MCLGIPGQVVSLVDAGGLRMGKVKFGGIIREACLEYVSEIAVGDYVIVHAGFAISKVNEEEAARTYQLLEEMGQLAELQQSDDEGGPPSQGPEEPEQRAL